jgi:hypothetical protein
MCTVHSTNKYFVYILMHKKMYFPYGWRRGKPGRWSDTILPNPGDLDRETNCICWWVEEVFFLLLFFFSFCSPRTENRIQHKKGRLFKNWMEPKRKVVCVHHPLKVPKREIFDRSDFPDFYTIKSLRVGDFGVKIKKIFTKYLGVHLGVQSSLCVCSVYF